MGLKTVIIHGTPVYLSHKEIKNGPIFGPSSMCNFHGLKAGGLVASGTAWPGLGLRTLRNFWLSVRRSAMCRGSGESTEPVHVRLSVLWEMAALLGLMAGVPPGDLYLTHICLITKHWHKKSITSSINIWQILNLLKTFEVWHCWIQIQTYHIPNRSICCETTSVAVHEHFSGQLSLKSKFQQRITISWNIIII